MQSIENSYAPNETEYKNYSYYNCPAETKDFLGMIYSAMR